MNRAQLVEEINKDFNDPKLADLALRSTLAAIQSELKRGGQVSIVGFGTFHVKEHPPHLGKNPRTGEPMNIPAIRRAKFRSSKGMLDR